MHSIVDEDRNRAAARRYLPRGVFDFIDGGAEDEWGVENNRLAFRRIGLVPRVLTGAGWPKIDTELLGEDYDRPFGVSPMGLGRIAGPKTDMELAKAAARYGMPYGLSMVGSSTLEDVHEASDGRAWFQVYICDHPTLVETLIERAKKVGYRTLVVTVDANYPGVRRRNIRNGFTVPFRLTPRIMWDFSRRPGWSLRTLAGGAPRMRLIESELDASDMKKFMAMMAQAPLRLDVLKRLRELWPGKLIVKGVMHPGDAAGIVAAGADGIVVSNHGARQIGSVAPSIEMLPLFRKAVGPDFALLLDSGVREGEDIVKALALGADFVLMGRPFLFSAACARPAEGISAFIEGVSHSVQIAMAQTGCAHISELDDRILVDSTQIGAGEADGARPIWEQSA
ncbi:MAG: alpha-hydroxy acid oxidase [Pseudomonadota bacterium]|nr:alpha-hydroxy acid oxidase [Pseudomonadota bacterium]